MFLETLPSSLNRQVVVHDGQRRPNYLVNDALDNAMQVFARNTRLVA